MISELKHFAKVLGLLLATAFIIFLINQIAGVVGLASEVHPYFGIFILLLAVAGVAILIGYPLYLWWKLPPALIPPHDKSSPEYDRFLEAYRKRLRTNPVIRESGIDVMEENGLEAGSKVMELAALKLTQNSAGAVFLSTAISQSGRLDAFMVLMAQTRLVWNIAKIYNQRPNPRELLWLYTNVAGTTFLASKLEDIDISQQVTPVVSKVMGNIAGGAIPGFATASSILTNMVFEGTVNAFLTLRVGAITRLYCDPLNRETKSGARRLAIKEAAIHLGSIVAEGSQKVSSTFWSASKGAASDVIGRAGGAVKGVGKRVTDRFTRIRKPSEN
ncbi:MAG: YcjF family protein [Verrucomicrobiae bacterium]|nr:YcjF family protein [Verrucomicrobiae bacterium]